MALRAGPIRAWFPPTARASRFSCNGVPEVKSGKNRLHLDLRTADLDAEVERVVALGGLRLTSKPVTEHGWRWHILADPDGNEFCILQPPTAYWERQPPGT
jgi:Glyoxalase-like domain